MNAERVAGFFWLVFGLAVMYGSFQLGLGIIQKPGSGFMGFFVGAFVSLMASIILAQTFLRKDKRITLSALWKDMKWRPLTVALLILAYLLVLERLGFILTSLIFLFTIFKWVEKLSWPKAGLLTLAVVVFAYLLFHTFLKSPLPQGIFGF